MNGLFYKELVPIYFEGEKYETICKYYDVFLSNLGEFDERIIAIISNRICEKNGHKYLEIIGLDIFTCKIVSLIDNHGKSFGVCSYSEDWAKLKSKTVIKVPVELCENVFVQADKKQSVKLFNALRIKGKYEALGKTNWITIKEKYNDIFHSYENDFNKLLIEPPSVLKIFELFKNCENSIIYIPVYFPGTHQIKKEDNKVKLYNPKTQKSFNFISATKKLLDNEGKYLEGIVIAKIIIINGKIKALIDEAIICKYFLHSKTERAEKNSKKKQNSVNEFRLFSEMDFYQDDYFLEELDYSEQYYSEQYRPYKSMGEFCAEYEEYRENQYSDGLYYEEYGEPLKERFGNIKIILDEDYQK